MQEIETIAVNKILDFARAQTTEIWHQMVMDWNWDNYKQFLKWLIDNPDTDKATILMIYWKSAPGKGFRDKQLIEERYINNYYHHQSLAFDPESDEGDNWVSYLPRPEKESIPKELLHKLEGKNVPYPEGYIEGMPENLFDKIEALYD
ncbi:DUF4274 domain-containing protein [Sphingobacterium sp. BIGb0165]|uniref:DUF4274 domain-containing protein n=1 Tax=Sphingobacterium sp. BIGb0165 TaxID=2940615 RepID=UPI002168BBA4|nr:DUF4274 domain-containing protein [Sphingobacterium sp. BIGb0165]MCS4225906.1 hypothetical protein [Sphingobacterium sp. BIGb0165]